jgi:signal recognition particle subunit SRP54
MKKLGPLQDLLAMMPGIPGKAGLKDLEVDERELARTEAIICSMTPKERLQPSILNGSCRSRIARGSGTSVGQVNGLLKQYDQARKMMKQLGGMKGLGKLGGLKLPGMG